MKKKLMILLAALFLITSFAGCSSKNEETQSANDGNYGASGTQGEEQTNDIVFIGRNYRIDGRTVRCQIYQGLRIR